MLPARTSSRILLAAAALLGGAVVTSAATITKAGSGTDLTLAGAWDVGVPTSADVATWTSSSLGGALTLGTSSSWLGISVVDATADIALSGAGTLTLGSSGITLADTGKNLSIGNAITLGAEQSWTVNTGRTLTASGAVGGSARLNKYGAGTLVLSGTNTYSGGTEIYGGVLSIAAAANLGSGYLGIKNDATLRYTGAGASAFSGTVWIDQTNATVEVEQAGGTFTIWRTGGSFTKQLTKTGAGTLRFGANGDNPSGSAVVNAGVLEAISSASNNFAVVTVNSGGTFRIGTTDGAGNAMAADRQVWNGGTVTVNSGGTFDLNGLNETVATLNLNGTGVGGAGALVNNNGSTTATPTATTFNLATTSAIGGSANVTVSGVIGGSGGLIKRGAGTLTLGGANTFSGGTTVSQGTVAVSNASGLGSSGAITLGDASSGASNASLLISAFNLSRAITVSNNGTGTFTLGANGAVLNPEFSGAITLQRDVTLAGGTNTDRLTFSGGITGTGNVTITGPNRVVLTNTANTFAGNLTIASGATLQLEVAVSTTRSYIPDAAILTVNGTLNLAKGSNSETVGGLAGSGTIQGHPGVASVASALVIDNAANHTFSGVLSNGGASGATLSLTKNGTGTQTLSGASTYTGTTTVNAGTLVFGNKNALGAFISGRPVSQVVVNSGGAIDFKGIIDATYGYTISGSGVGGTGALLNTGSTIGNGTAQTSNIKLAADATIGGTGNWALLTNGFGATSLDLAGNTLTKVGSNTFVLVNSTVTAGNIRVSAGRVAVAVTNSSLANVALTLDNTSGVFFENNGNFAVTLGSLAGGGATGGGVLLGSGSLNVGGLGTSTSYAGPVTGSGSLTKSGNGTLTLSGGSSYSGGTTLSAGALAVGSNTALGSGTVTVSSAGGIRSTDSTARSLSNNLALSANTTLGDAVANGSLTFGGTTSLGATRTLTTASDVTLSGIVSGGSLTKLGNGRLTLGGVAHTFSGDLTVSAGSLGLASGATLATSKIVMGDGTSLVAASGFTLGSGKQLQIGASGSGTVSVSGAFALGGGTLSLDIDPLLPDLLAVDGNLDLSSGTLAFTPVGGAYASGTYTVISYTGSLTGSVASLSTSGLVAGSAASRLNFSLDDSVAGAVSLVVDGASASLRWTGAAGATWDSGASGSANWTPVGDVNYTGETDRFYDLDAVAFDDTGSNRTIDVGGSLTVGAMTFSNAATDYTLTGAGSLGGLASIAKSGAGALDLDVAYTGSGGVSLAAGTLRLLDAGFAPGLGATVAVSGGRLEVAAGVTLGSAPLSITGGTVAVLSSAALGSGSATIDGGTLELAATGTYSKALALGASGATVAATAAGTTTLSPSLAFDSTFTASASANSILRLTGTLSGAGGLTKAGAGNVNVAAATTYSGATTVSEGLLVIESTLGASGSYAGAVAVSQGAVLSLTSSSNQTLAGAITGAGSLAKSGGGTLTLAVANAGFTGAFFVSNSTLTLGHSQAAGTAVISLDNATISRNAANTTVANDLVIASGGGTIAGRQPIDSYTTFSGAISGSGNVRIDGLVQLSGVNTGFTGNYVLADAGSYLRFATGSTASVSAANHVELANVGALRVDGSATDVTYTIGGLSSTGNTAYTFATSDAGGHNVLLDLAVSGTTRTYSSYFTKNGTNNFRIRKSGSGTQVLNNTAANGNGEGLAHVYVTGGVLELAGASMNFNAGYFGGSQAFTVSNGGTLRASQAWNLAAGNNITVDGGVLDVTDDRNYLNTLSLAGGATASGTLRLGNTGNATYSSSGNATNTISAIQYLVNVGGRTATFNVSDGSQEDDLVVSGAISDLPMDSSNVSYAGTVVSKTGAGTMVLSGANTFAGNLSIAAGAIRVTGTLGNGSYAGAIANSGVLAIQSASDQTLSGLITGNGGLVKSGSGILTLSGANSGFSGNVQLLDGTLVLGNVSALGSGAITLSGGTLDLANYAVTNVINFAGGSLINAGSANVPVTVTGNVSAATINNLPGAEITLGAGVTVDLSTVTKDIVVSGNATLQNLASFTGKLAVAGALDLSSAGNRPSGAMIELRAGGTLDFGSSTPFTGSVDYKGGAIQGAFSGTVNVSGTGVALDDANIASGKVVVGTGASVDLSDFTGTVRLTGDGGVTAGLPTFSGTLELGAGSTLNLTTLGGSLDNATVTVDDGATMRGTGTVGDTTLASGGALAPGNSPGSLTYTNLTLQGGASIDFEIANTGGGLYPPVAGSDYDALVVNGLLDISGLSAGNTLTLNLISLITDGSQAGDLGDFDPSGTYAFDLFTYGQISPYEGSISQYFTLDGAALTFNGAPVDMQFWSIVDTVNGNGDNVIQLQYAPIPEPSTYGLVLGGLALAGAAVRRRRAKRG